MSYTLSDINTLNASGTPRVGAVAYLWTEDGTGRYAYVGCWFNGAYSIEPTIDADGSARSLSGGVYSGWFSDSVAPYRTSEWLDFTPGLDADTAALAAIRGSIGDSSIAVAVAAALAIDDGVPYGTAIGTLGPMTLTHVGDFGTATTSVTSPVPRSPIYEPMVWVSSNPSVATVVDTSSSGIVSCQVTEVAAGTCTITGTTGSRAAPVLSVSFGVTCL